ncbi:MAG: phosphoribosylglycinamide formyltransferase [Candidatus Adiutrix sp.]|jgi:phosphoribosylglycinamide formyltransferase-1|nr:phosphoribosylglycinamide formyltransferase [Candidatus Adiutrix sp.]
MPEKAALKPALGFLVSGRGSNMAAVLAEIEAGRLAAEARVVVCDNPAAPALEVAARRGVPAVLIDRAGFTGRRDFEEEIARTLKDQGVTLVVLAGFMRLIGPTLLGAFPGRVINIHPSLLPAFPGLRAQKQALDYGVRISGCTVHYVNEVMDGGRIIAQEAVEVAPGDTEETLSGRILAQEHRLLARAIAEIAPGLA